VLLIISFRNSKDDPLQTFPISHTMSSLMISYRITLLSQLSRHFTMLSFKYCFSLRVSGTMLVPPFLITFS
jgi:hypothetical protein